MVRPEIMKEVQMIEDSLKRRVSVGAKISQAKVVKEFTKQVRELASQAHWYSHLTPLPPPTNAVHRATPTTRSTKQYTSWCAEVTWITECNGNCLYACGDGPFDGFRCITFVYAVYKQLCSLYIDSKP